MSVSWAGAAVVASVVGTVAAADSSRKATNSAKDANAAALASQEDATNARLDFDKQTYADGAGDRQFASDMARTNATNQAEDRNKYNALQDEQIVRGRVFQGAEDQMLVDAQNWDTPQRRAEAAAKAGSSVEQNMASQRGITTRAQQRMGVNPSSGKALAMDNQMAIQGAAMQAGAQNNASTQVETQGYARKMDALGLGKGMIGNQATQAGLQLSAGNSAVSNSLVPFNVSNAANNTMSQGYGNAAAGYGALATNQMNSFNTAQNYGATAGSNVGSMFGNLATKLGSSGFFTPSVTDGGYSIGQGSAYGGSRKGL